MELVFESSRLYQMVSLLRWWKILKSFPFVSPGSASWLRDLIESGNDGVTVTKSIDGGIGWPATIRVGDEIETLRVLGEAPRNPWIAFQPDGLGDVVRPSRSDDDVNALINDMERPPILSKTQNNMDVDEKKKYRS
eukprot:TRINITY_DN3901_c0_g1_i4.p1 TRINITY_DN3901_c0_g1~~TRINITY_DN3901_c0_g1_i4.p1  ORF type:complete len:136 (-),score=10.33 TRINITY_DN3901_c0_g1_i4:50-457(-)